MGLRIRNRAQRERFPLTAAVLCYFEHSDIRALFDAATEINEDRKAAGIPSYKG